MISRCIAKRMAAIFAAVLLCGITAIAQPSRSPAEGNPPGSAASGHQASSDKKFVKKAWDGGIAEIQIGRLAASKGENDEVKGYGQKMVETYTELGDRLRPIAAKMGVSTRANISASDRALLTKLQQEGGKQFDGTYIQAMVKRHRKNLTEFRHEAQTAQDPAVKDFAMHGAQVIAEHASLVQKLAESNHAAPSPTTGNSPAAKPANSAGSKQ